MTRFLAAVGLGLIVLAALVVPMPLVVIAPGSALPTARHVEIGRPADDISGEILLMTVRVGQPTLVEAVDALVDDDEDLLLRERVIPRGVDAEHYREQQVELFDESGLAAAVVGLRAAGVEVEVRGEGARIDAVVPGSPAEGVLQTGDVVVAAGGEPVEAAADLVRAVGAGDGGPLELRVRRGDDVLDRTIRPEQVSGLERPVLGVSVATAGLSVDLPFDVDVSAEGIGGPSAGLVLALTVYELVAPGDLTDGRTIAGTGSIDLDGRVGAIGGVEQKVAAAVDADADVFLVPAAQADIARDAAPPDLDIVPVSTFDDAIRALSS